MTAPLAGLLVVMLPLLPGMVGCSGPRPDGWVEPARSPHPVNALTADERRAGFRLLFDGTGTDGWRGYRRPDVPRGWQVVDGCLVRTGPAGDIITVEQFDSFELRLEWKIEPGGNSGIFYCVTEDGDWVWETGPEFQILDNEGHADGLEPSTMAGANYALHAPPWDASYRAGSFNTARIVVHGDHVEHWLNGELQVSYELGSPDWEARVARSKFGAMPLYGRARRGHIALQDHGDKVWFRTIRIRPTHQPDPE